MANLFIWLYWYTLMYKIYAVTAIFCFKKQLQIFNF